MDHDFIVQNRCNPSPIPLLLVLGKYKFSFPRLSSPALLFVSCAHPGTFSTGLCEQNYLPIPRPFTRAVGAAPTASEGGELALPASAGAAGGGSAESGVAGAAAQPADGLEHSPVVSLVSLLCPSSGGAGSAGTPAAPTRILRLTMQTLEVWKVIASNTAGNNRAGAGSSAGSESLEGRYNLLPRIEAALGGRKSRLVDVAVVGVSLCQGSNDGAPSSDVNLDVLVLAAAVGGGSSRPGRTVAVETDFSVHLVRFSPDEAVWSGTSVKVCYRSCQNIQLPTFVWIRDPHRSQQ